MQVILRADIQRLGKAGDLVTVKEGYARNFLIPQGLAVKADPKNVKALEHARQGIERQVQKQERETERLAQALESLSLTFIRQASEEGKLFGSVTNLDIQEELNKAGIGVERKKVILKEPIKSLGESQIAVKIGQKEAWVKISVIKPEAEE